MNISCAFAPSLSTPDHIALAEELGYANAWVYDSPSVYADPWMVLALAAARTGRIGLGPAVLVPSLRHPLANASAIATLAGLAPGRAAAAFGTGLTGRMLLGERPLRWAEVAEYVRAVRALLAGEQVDWQGKRLQMLQPPGFAADRPVDVPLLLGAEGPKGLALADEIADGVFTARPPASADGLRRVHLTFGTVLDDGESPGDARVVAAVGPALTVAYHAIYEAKGAAGVDRLPGGASWRAEVEAIDPAERHLAVHAGHGVATNAADEKILAEAVPLIPKWTYTGTAENVRERVTALADKGITEIAYQPIGDDIPRELERFIAAVRP